MASEQRKFTIQETLGAFLSTHGEHEAAAKAFAATERAELQRLGELAIRTAPDWDRADTARAVKLALDSPDAGGPNEAADFVIKKEPHPMQDGAFIYRGYIVEQDENLRAIGLVNQDLKGLFTAMVRAFVIRKLTFPEGDTF